MKTKYPFICFAIILLLPIDAMTHSGRTDSTGGHNDRKNGGYHDHNGGKSSSNSSYGTGNSDYQHYSSQIEPTPPASTYIPYSKPIIYKCNGIVVTRNDFYNCTANSKNSDKIEEEKSKIDMTNDDKKISFAQEKTVHSISYMVSKILNADTFQPSGKNSKIILYGVDAPVEGQPFHDEAENMLKNLVHKKKVTAKIYAKSKDGADIAVIFVGGKNVNELMVESGYAWIYRDSCSEAFCDDWLEREEEAKLQKIGLWNDPGRLPPWVWK